MERLSCYSLRPYIRLSAGFDGKSAKVCCYFLAVTPDHPQFSLRNALSCPVLGGYVPESSFSPIKSSDHDE